MRTPFSNDLPRGWVRTTLEEISEIILGQSPPSSTYNTDGKGLPFYQGKLEFGKRYPTPRKWCTAPKKIAEKGDVFISIRAPVGPTNLCPEKSAVGRGLAAIRGLGGIQSFFIFYLIRRFENEIANKGTGTTFNAITGNQLKNFEIPVPPLAEQRRIVAKLDTLFTQLDAAVDSLKQTQTQLQRYRRSILKVAFDGELTRKWREEHSSKPQSAEASTGLPKDWERTTVGCVIKNISLTGKKLKKRDYESDGELPVIDQGLSFIGGYTNNEKLKVECELPVIVFGDHTKAIKYVDFDFVGGADGIKVIKSQEMYHSKLFYYFIRAISLPDRGYSRHFQFLEKAQIPIPPLTEQAQTVSEIERHLSVADEIEATIKSELKRAERLRQSILKHAFSGKLVPQDPNDEPASALLERIQGEKESQQPKQRKKTTKLKAKDSDDYPLLTLAGELEPNDTSIGDASLVELRGGKGE